MAQTDNNAAGSPPHRACTQLMVSGLTDDTISRLVLGVDDRPQLLGTEEMSAQLQDSFAAHLLRAGIFPNTAGEVLQALEQGDPGGPLSQQRFFLLGEGSQLAAGEQRTSRNMRFLITCGAGPDGPEVIVSSFHPDQGMVEVMSWDLAVGGFNFYRTMPDSNAWVFAGNSRHALTEPTRGQGPFESHINGHLLMKELKTPWVNWHSTFAQISPSSLAAQGLDTHPWVQRLDTAGAYTLEEQAVRPAIRRWTAARVQGIVAGTAQETPARMLEQLTGTLTVNLVSSFASGPSPTTTPSAAPVIDLPSTFFVDEDLLDVVGLPGPSARFNVEPTIYAQAISALNVRLDDGATFTQPGETHFAFVVPERAFEDVATIAQAVSAGLLTKRLVAALLMVDFPNPTFSTPRGALQRHIDTVSWTGEGTAYSEAVAAAITGTEQATTSGSPEAAFAENWAIGDDFVPAYTAALTAYYDEVTKAVGTVDGFTTIYRLAESRRAHVKKMPIFENPLLFPTSDADGAELMMRADATVQEVS